VGSGGHTRRNGRYLVHIGRYHPVATELISFHAGQSNGVVWYRLSRHNPIGATLVGYLTQHVNARAPFVLASIGTMVCGVALLRSTDRLN
jgi:hypothetical protein